MAKVKQFIVLIGLPGSGKSTYLQQLLQVYPKTVVTSRDDIVEKYAKQYNIDYNAAYVKYASEIDEDYKVMMENVRNSLPDIVVSDRTNLTTKSRDKLSQYFKDKRYKITYVFFKKPVRDADKYVWNLRMNSRPGKTIPDGVAQSMYDSYVDFVEEDARIKPDIVVKINGWGR